MTRRNLLLAGVAGVAGLAAAPLLAGTALANAPVKFYLDPGHGGSETGAVGNGLVEKDLTLDISLQIRDLLNANGNVDVRMSRETDVYRSLDYRSSDANSWGAAFFVSVHINAGGGTGFESYRYTSPSDETVRAHGILHPAIHTAMGDVTDRGKKSANFHVLRETAMPALLTENLFIDTQADAELLSDPAFITATAEGHANGILEYLGV